MALFNKIAERYDDWYQTPLGTQVDKDQKKIIFHLADLQPGDVMLDFGCGTGNYSLAAARCGAVVTGVDLSAGMLAEARKKAEAEKLKISWLNKDFSNLPFPKETFDLVLSVTALEFFADPRGALLEAMRVLKPGGRLIAGVLNAESSWGDIYRKEAAANPASIFAAARLYTAAELQALLPGCNNIITGAINTVGQKGPALTETASALDPGLLAARWDKPPAEGAKLSCQISLYPLGISQINPVIEKALKVFDCYPISYKINAMSTIISGGDKAVWAALQAFAARSMEDGANVVINTVISNSCGCGK